MYFTVEGALYCDSSNDKNTRSLGPASATNTPVCQRHPTAHATPQKPDSDRTLCLCDHVYACVHCVICVQCGVRVHPYILYI